MTSTLKTVREMSPKEEEFILNIVFILEERTLMIIGIYSPDIISSMQCSVATQRQFVNDENF